MIKEFPKIFSIGTKYILDIFDGPVEITEKIDGSQFSFAKIADGLYFRSKGQELYDPAIPKMFMEGVKYLKSISDDIPPGLVFYCEYLQKPRHNALKYNRTPDNHLALFAVRNFSDGSFDTEFTMKGYAGKLGIDYVPVLYYGTINAPLEIMDFMQKESYLGGAKIEGVVVKNYAKDLILGGHVSPIMCGKFVSEEFKEVNQKSFKDNSGKNKFEEYKDSFRTEARWQKAVQHLRDAGTLTGDPKDIGPLIREVVTDIEAEEGENIKEWLYKNYRAEILRKSTAGIAEWYKMALLEGNNG